MAWRIHNNVVRGEIDNRERGHVRGRIWLHGQSEPITLDFAGNAAPDLAGCLLEFQNPRETFPLYSAHFARVQSGRIGDITASRKVMVSDQEDPESAEGKTSRRHLANCLYVEWFSEANGRVVVESTDYALTISSPAWQLSPEEEQARQELAGENFKAFVDKLSEQIEPVVPDDGEWDEFDYEKLLKESDLRTEIYRELLDKYKDDPDRDQIVAREMGWDKAAEADETGADSEGHDDELDAELDETAETEELEPDPATEGVDWVRDENQRPRHPLALRASTGATALWRLCDKLGLTADEKNEVSDLLFFYEMIAAKLAGALDVLAYGRDTVDPAFTVACLKRVLPQVQTALGALDKAAHSAYLPEETLIRTRAEFFALREEILNLMQEFRNA